MPDLSGRFVLLHFSPIRDTLKGELEELYPFLGSTRLEEVIDRYTVTAVFHAHAHYGSQAGKTEKSIPVYNASYPLLLKATPQRPYVMFEI
jgi:Icc-related predicted phosphoesterase